MACGCLAMPVHWNLQRPPKPGVATLFRDLQSPKTTRQAAIALRELAESDRNARAYLDVRLPAMIAKNPTISPEPWASAVQLAGELRITAAAPSLAKWIGVEAGEITMTQFLRLETIPTGKALSEIGNPAIPSLIPVLRDGSSKERRNAYLTLNAIHSPEARTAMRDGLARESDPALVNFIEKVISSD